MSLKSTKFFFLISLGLLTALTILLLLPSSTFAITLNIPINGKAEVADIGEYLAIFYKYFIGIIGILATVMIMFGGFRWITAAGSPEKIKEAKSNIMSAIIAVVLMLCSYLILNLINPALVSFELDSLATPSNTKNECAATDKTPCNEINKTGNCKGQFCPQPSQKCILKDEKRAIYECKDLKTVCESVKNPQTEEDCNKYHNFTGKTANNQVTGQVCTKSYLAGCLLKDILVCPPNYPEPAACSESGECSEAGLVNPKGKDCAPPGSQVYGAKCTDAAMVGKGMGAICCKTRDHVGGAQVFTYRCVY